MDTVVIEIELRIQLSIDNIWEMYLYNSVSKLWIIKNITNDITNVVNNAQIIFPIVFAFFIIGKTDSVSKIGRDAINAATNLTIYKTKKTM